MKKKTIFKFQSVTGKLLSAIFLSVCIIFSICVYYSFAEVPCKINYQGRLIENNVPVDGTREMRFTIYDSAAGGNELWTSENVDITVYNGLFRYVLDLSSIDDWTAGEELYLQVVVEGEPLTPREAIYAYPYAINSHLLEGATKEYFINTSGETQKKDGGLNIMGNVGIGTTSPDYGLDVDGSGRFTGDLTVGQTLTATSPVINGSVSGTAIVDDDTMVSVSDKTLCTGESIKTYVDNQVSPIKIQNIEVINGSHNVEYTRNHTGYVKIQFIHVCRSDAGILTIRFKVDGVVQKQFTVNTNYITVPSPTFVYYGQKSGDFKFKLEVSQSGGAYSAMYTQFIVTKY